MNAAVDMSLAMQPEPRGDRLSQLRDAIAHFTGTVFYAPLLRSARTSSLKGTIGHGGRGEEVFQGQLDQILIERAGQASKQPLNDLLFARLSPGAIGNQTENQTR